MSSEEYQFREVPLFYTHDELEQRKGKFSMRRFNYLQALVTEFQDTDDEASLANFSYDPVNYSWLRKLHVIDLFLDMLTEENAKLKEFGIAGLANLCDESKGIPLIIKCLSSPHEETVLSALYTLSSLCSVFPKSISELSGSVVDAVKKYSQSKNNRLKNLAFIFLESISSSTI